MTVYHGDIFYCKDREHYVTIEDGYICVGDSGRIDGVYPYLPRQYEDITVKDYGHRLIIPSFCDIHLHSSQFVNTGLGYDIPFEDWLLSYTYPAEQRYRNLAEADGINKRLINRLWYYGSMRAVIMGSTDLPSVRNLMENYDKSGMCAYIGKMNADIASFGNQAEDTVKSIEETKSLIETAARLSEKVSYCISPEFIPNCSDQLMTELGKLAVQYHLPVQSHLSESESDVQAVKERYPSLTYAEAYDRFQLFGQTPTVMAHAIHADRKERLLMKERNITLAHCPVAISNIPSSRTMPLREFVEDGVNVGLGSDIGGGHTVNMMRIIEQTVHYSKFQQFIDKSRPFSIYEAYALATLGGGGVFGRVGSFEKDYSFDALIIEDEKLSPREYGYSLQERLARFLYEGDAGLIMERYCKGKKIDKPFPEIEA